MGIDLCPKTAVHSFYPRWFQSSGPISWKQLAWTTSSPACRGLEGAGGVWSIHHASDVFFNIFGNILDYKWLEGYCYLVDWNTCLVVSTGVQVVFQVQMFKGINLSEFATPLCHFTFKRIQHQKDAYLQLHCFSELESFYWLPDDMIRHAPSIQHTFIYFWISQGMYHNHIIY